MTKQTTEQPTHPKKGEHWETLDGASTCRVMSDPIEGYVLARYKGAIPWCIHVSDWHKKFKKPVTATK